MELEWKLFADLAERAGERHVTVEVGPDATVGDALDALLDGRPDLRERACDGERTLRAEINVLRNGTDVGADALETPVEADDELALFPPVSGG